MCKQITYQILKTMEYLHSDDVSVCHRDVNPNNLMISILKNKDPLFLVEESKTDCQDDEVKAVLIDFNVSRRFREPK